MDVRQQIIRYMQKKEISQADLAKQLGKSRQVINQTLLYRGGVSKSLLEILESLDLELTVTPKKPQEEKPKPAYLSLVGLLDDPDSPGDVSSRVDHYLGEALESEHQESLEKRR